MTNTLTWLSGTSYPSGPSMYVTLVGTGPGMVKFSKGGSITGLGGLPTNPVSLDQNNKIQLNLAIGNPADGVTLILTATPLKANGVDADGSPAIVTITFYKYDADSGEALLTNTNFVKTPATSPTQTRGYWRLYMEANKAAGPAPIAGAMVQFSFDPPHNIAVYTDDPAPKQLTPVLDGYWVPTASTGLAAVRVVTLEGTMIQSVHATAHMVGTTSFLQEQCYFATNLDMPDADMSWLPPSTDLDDNGRIEIPDSGRTFNLDISVNGEDDPQLERFIIFNDDAALPYPYATDGSISVPYSILNQSQDPQANSFTYARQTKSGNVKVTLPMTVGVDGSRANLPDPNLPNRVAPAPLVDPSPGPGTTINLNTLNKHKGLGLAVSDFKASLLPGLNTTGTLTVVFYFYMNGYDYDGSDRASQIYSSDQAQYNIIAPTITYDTTSQSIKFSTSYAVLPRSLAEAWGRDPFTNDKKKVGFEYVISDGTGTWYSYYDDRNSWYYIDTGSW